MKFFIALGVKASAWPCILMKTSERSIKVHGGWGEMGDLPFNATSDKESVF